MKFLYPFFSTIKLYKYPNLLSFQSPHIPGNGLGTLLVLEIREYNLLILWFEYMNSTFMYWFLLLFIVIKVSYILERSILLSQSQPSATTVPTANEATVAGTPVRPKALTITLPNTVPLAPEATNESKSEKVLYWALAAKMVAAVSQVM